MILAISNPKHLNFLLKKIEEEKLRKEEKYFNGYAILLRSVCEDLFIMVPFVAIETLLEEKKMTV